MGFIPLKQKAELMKRAHIEDAGIVAAFVALTDMAAMIQFVVIEVETIRLHYFILPSAVGALFGTVLIYTRRYYRRSKEAERFEKAAKTDYLTGTLNRYAFYTLIESEMERAKRKDRTFSLAMMDIDDFKKINDRYGHRSGDEVLVLFCELVKSGLRATDHLNRWGGEEFMALLPETTLEEALSVTERIRKKVSESSFGLDEPVTVSIGITRYGTDDTIETMIERVDNALYDAKRLGKNRIERR